MDATPQTVAPDATTPQKRYSWRTFADTALKTAAQFWFVVAVIGQWIFAFYISTVYGTTAAYGNFQAWNKTLAHGYESGNPIGNIGVGVHLLFAAVITIAGPLQLIPQIRSRFPVFHRWLGRIYIPVAFIMGVTGLYLSWSGRRVVGDLTQHIPVEINAVLIILCAAMAWRYAVIRDFRTHRRWALRLFLVVGGVWFFRLGLMFWLLVNNGPVGFDQATFTGPFLTFLSYAQYLLPLAVLEIYLRMLEHSGAFGRLATSALLFVLTLVMATGIFAATTGLWLPRIKATYDPRKSIAETLSVTITSSGVDSAVKQYQDLKDAQPTVYNFDENQLNTLGYELIRAKKFKEAVRIFQLNVEVFPQSSNTYDSLGEAYLDDGQKPEATSSYQKSLQLNPNNRNAIQVLERLGAR
jgi:hypothetical protein